MSTDKLFGTCEILSMRTGMNMENYFKSICKFKTILKEILIIAILVEEKGIAVFRCMY